MNEERLKIIRAKVGIKGAAHGSLFVPAFYKEDVSELLSHIEQLEDKINELEDYSADLEEEIRNMQEER